jgi:long-chain acyl-CoA synthetase
MGSAASERVVEQEGLALDAGTLCEAFQRTAARYSKEPALRSPGDEQGADWSEYAARVRRLATGLAAAGLGRGDTLAMMLSNRPEAVIVDSAAMHLGAIPFSVYNTSSSEQVEYLLSHAGCRLVVTEAQFAPLVLDVASRLDSVERVYVVDGPVEGAHDLAELETTAADDGFDFDFEAAWRAVAPSDVATLIYTSGTTGPPKAVELTHENLLWQVRLAHRVLPLRPGGRIISYLPMAHLADRCGSHYQCLISGSCATFVADMTQVIAVVAEVRPTSWGAVPRVWEKLKAALEAGIAAGADPAAMKSQLGLDEVDHLISGAAPIAPEVLEFFAGLGLPICEVWGMSELSLIATTNPPEAIRIGTVGPALPGVELSLATDGELLVRGPTVMRGYRGDPQKTAETIDAEGWLHTGDIAEIDRDGYVRIVDRKKELIINAAGKNMSPANIENKLKAACPLIGSAVAIGDRRPYNTALVVLDPVAAASFAASRGSTASSPAELAADPAISEEVERGVRQANDSLSRVEQVKRHTLLGEEWQPGGDELTPTMKLKRKPIAEKYAEAIDAMYATP